MEVIQLVLNVCAMQIVAWIMEVTSCHIVSSDFLGALDDSQFLFIESWRWRRRREFHSQVTRRVYVSLSDCCSFVWQLERHTEVGFELVLDPRCAADSGAVGGSADSFLFRRAVR